jgi:hypothetical protein
VWPERVAIPESWIRQDFAFPGPTAVAPASAPDAAAAPQWAAVVAGGDASSEEFGVLQPKNGPCGVLAVEQAVVAASALVAGGGCGNLRKLVLAWSFRAIAHKKTGPRTPLCE